MGQGDAWRDQLIERAVSKRRGRVWDEVWAGEGQALSKESAFTESTVIATEKSALAATWRAAFR